MKHIGRAIKDRKTRIKRNPEDGENSLDSNAWEGFIEEFIGWCPNTGKCFHKQGCDRGTERRAF